MRLRRLDSPRRCATLRSMQTQRNTRSWARFKSGIGTNVSVTCEGHAEVVSGQLLDMNKAGGLGLFVPVKGPFERLPVASLYGPWKVARTTKGTGISLQVRFFSVIPTLMYGDQGVRISASISPKGGASAASGAPQRRHSIRLGVGPMPVILSRRTDRMEGDMVNVSGEDGVGFLVKGDQMKGLTWGGLFASGWRLFVGRHSLLCHFRRCGIYGDRIVLGGIAPGITRLAKVKTGEKESAGRGETLDDNTLIAFLDEFMSGVQPSSGPKR